MRGASWRANARLNTTHAKGNAMNDLLTRTVNLWDLLVTLARAGHEHAVLTATTASGSTYEVHMGPWRTYTSVTSETIGSHLVNTQDVQLRDGRLYVRACDPTQNILTSQVVKLSVTAR